MVRGRNVCVCVIVWQACVARMKDEVRRLGASTRAAVPVKPRTEGEARMSVISQGRIAEREYKALTMLAGRVCMDTMQTLAATRKPPCAPHQIRAGLQHCEVDLFPHRQISPISPAPPLCRIMPPKKLVALSLPPALTMKLRDGNKNKVVGAPDMPKPKRSHEQVQEEKDRKAHEKEEAARKLAATLQRIQELEKGAAEDTPTQGPVDRLTDTTHVQPPRHARQTGRRTVTCPGKAGPSGSPDSTESSCMFSVCPGISTHQNAPAGLRPISASTATSGMTSPFPNDKRNQYESSDTDSGDMFEPNPSPSDDEESSDDTESQMDVDVEDEEEGGKNKTRRGKKSKLAMKGCLKGPVGKRKQEVMAESEGT